MRGLARLKLHYLVDEVLRRAGQERWALRDVGDLRAVLRRTLKDGQSVDSWNRLAYRRILTQVLEYITVANQIR